MLVSTELELNVRRILINKAIKFALQIFQITNLKLHMLLHFNNTKPNDQQIVIQITKTEKDCFFLYKLILTIKISCPIYISCRCMHIK